MTPGSQDPDGSRPKSPSPYPSPGGSGSKTPSPQPSPGGRGSGASRVPRGSTWIAVGVIVYVVIVLGADALAALGIGWPWDWTRLRWFPFRGGDYPLLARFDAFKFLFWFAVPFAACIPRMDWGAWGVRRWQRRDVVLLVLLSALGALAVAIIPHVPSLAQIYGGAGLGRATPEQRLHFAVTVMVWNLSWLIGWEFLHRYALLRGAQARWPRFGWLLVPLAEGLYHLQKPGLEAVGMVAFSVVLCLWTLRRRNILLPMIAHLVVEVELLLFLLLV